MTRIAIRNLAWYAALVFAFPFAGSIYAVASVNTNGGIALTNTVGDEIYIDYEHWYDSCFEDEFTDLGRPSLVTFETNLDVTNQGTIYFNGLGDRVDDLGQGIVIGISAGEGATPPADIDFTDDSPIDGDTTIFEIWCYDSATNGNCQQTGQANGSFDLDQCNLVFEPDGSESFTATALCGGGMIFTPAKTQFTFGPNGWTVLLPQNGYRENPLGGIELVFEVIVRRIFCFHPSFWLT